MTANSRVSVAVLMAGLWSAGGLAQERAPLNVILDRATAYVAEFVTRFSRVVAEEQYEQDNLQASVEAVRSNRMGVPAGPPMPGSLRVTERRKLRSDVLLVRPAGLDGWRVFRDVFEVDGSAVRDRQERLLKLFVDSHDTRTALERANQLMDEGSRFNIRPMGTVDNPVLGLTFLQQPIRERFKFIDRGFDGSPGSNARVLEFRETARPTIIRTAQDKDIVAHGRYWLDQDSGHVLRTEVVFSALGSESSVTTTFVRDELLGINVPAEMRFRRSEATNEIRCVATYGSFRQFHVQTDESIKQ